jgi:hypothetical protein
VAVEVAVVEGDGNVTDVVAVATPLPKTPDEWLSEIELAYKDAGKTKPFALLRGQWLTNAKLFHLAPVVALKFRGRRTKGAEAKPENPTYLEIFRVFREFLRWVRRLIDVGSFACCSAS